MRLTTHSEPVAIWEDYCGTGMLDWDRPALMFSLRLGRCYELAASAIAQGDLYDGILVHGTMRCENPISERMGHGWVLIGENYELLWEPITGRCYVAEDWYAWAEAEEERRYDPAEMRVQMLKHGTYGRWHESEWP